MKDNLKPLISEIDVADRNDVAKFVSESWGSAVSVSRGKIYHVNDLPGFICRKNNKIVGLVTYHIDNKECEIITLDSKIMNKGLGSMLIHKVLDKAKESKCTRVWLITTNDNVHAIRFYQKRGFEWAGFHKNAIDVSRKLKPEIPEAGNDGIPIKHEIEFELKM
jgi:ribosomal protein S18 acetylase RimI-like enzyme